MDAVLFDMDGVIVDTENHWIAAAYDVLAEALAEPLEEIPLDPEEFAGMDAYEEHEYLRGMDGVTVQIDEDTYFDLYADRAEDIYLERAELMDGFRDLLTFLDAQDCKIGVVSGSYWVDLVLDRFDIADRFDVAIGADDHDMPGKPAPDVYLHAARELDVDPAACLVVEDSDIGVQAAHKAGMTVIGYGDSTGQDLDIADAVVATPHGLFEEIAARVARDR